FVYSVENGKTTQITDGMSDARRPAFDRDGQYLFFTASTNYGPTSSGLDMTSDEHEVNSSIYLAVLPNNIPSPLAPESDEEGAPRPATEGGRGGRGGAGGGAGAQPEPPPKPVRIDFDGLRQRILALPLPARNYTGLTTGRAGILFFTQPGTTAGGGRGFGGGGAPPQRLGLKTPQERKARRGCQRIRSLRERRQDAASHGWRWRRTWWTRCRGWSSARAAICDRRVERAGEARRWRPAHLRSRSQR